MQTRRWIKRLAMSIAPILTIGAISGCTEKIRVMPGVYESGYVMPFPLQRGGEQIDILVRVRDDKRPYQFNLIFVSRTDWPKEKKDLVRRIDEGFVNGDESVQPYPVKLRIRIDATDVGNGIRVDKVVSDRNPLYITRAENGTATWYAQRCHVQTFPPGIYRVRVDNLTSAPQIDFQTLFEFERDNRKY